MKQQLLEYVKMLQMIQNPGVAGVMGIPETTALMLTESGFPIIPKPWKGDAYNKKTLEDLLTNFLGQHYGKSSQQYVADNYLLHSTRSGNKWQDETYSIQSSWRSSIIFCQS